MDRSNSEMNLSQLTDEERQSILRVLKRDQALRTMDEKRLIYLRSELHMLKKRGALKPGLDSGSRCARCLTPLGLLLNSGADCFICLKKVCHSCRQNNEIAHSKGNSKQWACLVCSKQMELKAVSGDWMEVYKSSKSEEEKNIKSYELTKVLTQAQPMNRIEKTYASIPSQPHFSPTMSIRSAPTTCSKMDLPRRVQFSSGSPQSLTDLKKFPGNSNIPSPPVLKKRPLLLRNPALDHTVIDTEGSVMSKLAKVHPETKSIDDKERLPVTGVYYSKCYSRRDSSSSVSTCSLSSASLQGPSPRIERKNPQQSPLEFDTNKKSVVGNDFAKENASNPIGIVQLRASQNIRKFTNDRSISEPCYEIKVPREDQNQTLKSHSLGSYEEAHSHQALHLRNNNLISGSFENFSDTTSNSGPPSINSTHQSRPSSISPATFRRVLVSSYNDSSSSHSESELESTPKHSAQFPKVCLNRNSPSEPTYDENAMAHRSSPRGRLRARNKALSTSSDEGINRATGAVPQIMVSDHIETNSFRGSQSLSDKESIGLPEEDVDQVVSAYSRSQTSLFGARSESMSSVYSAAGGGRYGAVIVTGEILFSMSYNCKAGHLALHVKECRNVAPVDTKRNRSDPYVKVYLLPDKTKGGKRKTKVKKHTLNPVFDEVLKFVVTGSELDTRTIWLSVWHSDIFGRNDFLGEVTLPLSSKIVGNAQALKWYPLQERMDSAESSLTYKGDIILSLKFVPPDVTSKKPSRKGSSCSIAGTKGTLHVLVKEARNLMAMRSNGTSDPFCKSYLLPDKSKSGKQKTPVVKKSCNPKWNHTFVYEDISTEELKDRCLELTLWDYDKITSNDFLGGVRMNLGTGKYQGKDVDWMDAMGEELVLWRSMVDRPNQWIDAALMLRPSMSRRP